MQSKNPVQAWNSRINTPDRCSPVSPPYPYFRKGKYSCLTDDNMSYGNQGTLRNLNSESHRDHRQTRHRMKYRETESLGFVCPSHRPVRKRRPSFRNKPHRLMSAPRPYLLNHISSLPAQRFHGAYKYSGGIPHPDRHASGFENPCHYSWLRDIRFYPEMSWHLKTYSKNPLPVPRTDP